MQVKITTFNCENLFGRYRMLNEPWDKKPQGYESRIQVYEIVSLKPGREGRIKPYEIAVVQRKTTAYAILGTNTDILAVQEVENMSTLRIFNHIYLKNYFERIISIDGNDNRGIDVGFLIRRGFECEITDVRNHADEAIGGGWLPKSSRLDTKNLGKAIFSRDCLEVDIKIEHKVYTFLVNHFKAQDGKSSSTQKRINQAKRVKELTKKAIDDGKIPIVMGDLNIDVKQKNYDGSLDLIYNTTMLYDPLKYMVTAEDFWTHYYSPGSGKVSRLDYILVDKKLKSKVKSVDIFRMGLTPSCKKYTGPRLESMKGNDLEASDHCPTSVVLEL